MAKQKSKDTRTIPEETGNLAVAEPETEGSEDELLPEGTLVCALTGALPSSNAPGLDVSVMWWLKTKSTTVRGLPGYPAPPPSGYLFCLSGTSS
jgi:hypothetical protein